MAGTLLLCDGRHLWGDVGGLCALRAAASPSARTCCARSARSSCLAAALQSMRGADVPHLSRGLASCRVGRAAVVIVEPTVKSTKYGHAFTASAPPRPSCGL